MNILLKDIIALTLCPVGQVRSTGTELRAIIIIMQVSQRTRKKSGASRHRGERRVPFSAIRKLALEIAEKFHPEKIILFGSYAYGKPHRDSDVDLLVIMPAWNEISKACRIRLSVHHPFPLDLIVRTPENLKWRLAEEDWFLREVMEKGKVLYEKNNRRMGSKSRGGSCSRPTANGRQTAGQ